MFDLIDRLERQGPAGAPKALAIGAGLALVALAIAISCLTAGEEVSRWSLIAGGGATFLIGALATMFTMIGIRLRTGTVYPDPSVVFPSLTVVDFRDAVYSLERPLAACSNCRIHVPAAFSTGACPRCSSALDWHRIETDDDAKLVCLSITE